MHPLEWFPDKLVFTINGEPSLTYPKIVTDQPGQWPFDQPLYLLIDMQLGGKWVSWHHQWHLLCKHLTAASLPQPLS